MRVGTYSNYEEKRAANEARVIVPNRYTVYRRRYYLFIYLAYLADLFLFTRFLWSARRLGRVVTAAPPVARFHRRVASREARAMSKRNESTIRIDGLFLDVINKFERTKQKNWMKIKKKKEEERKEKKAFYSVSVTKLRIQIAKVRVIFASSIDFHYSYIFYRQFMNRTYIWLPNTTITSGVFNLIDNVYLYYY